MKRSNRVILALMGAAGILGGCSQEEDKQVVTFKDLDDCKSSGTYKPEVCDAVYKKAQESAQKELAFKSQGQCVSEFGADQCKQVHRDDGTSVFVPLMAGYMVSQALNGISDSGDRAEAEYYREKTRQLRREEVRKANEQTRSQSSYATSSTKHTSYGVAPKSRPVTVSRATVSSKPKATSFSRGGFGSSSSRGGWGG